MHLFAALMTVLAALSRPASDPPIPVPGLHAEARVTRDSRGVQHVRAHDQHDLFLMQGWVHAQDRLFQMDFLRRQASGTLAELIGSAALESDVLLRTIGLRRAAERSWHVASEEARAMLVAYAEGVNAYVSSHPLPVEHGALELTEIPPWAPVDSLAIAKLIAFGLSFELDVDRTVQLVTYLETGAVLGFDGGRLFTDDVERSAPFDPTITAPSGGAPLRASDPGRSWKDDLARRAAFLHPRALELGRAWVRRGRSVALLRELLDASGARGSNEWVVGGALTVDGFPLLASDPHLGLDTPSTFYPIHLDGAGIDVIGESFAGVPTVILGHNRNVVWSATTAGLDVTDVYQEQVLPDPSSPTGLATLHAGESEPVLAIPEEFRANQLDGAPDNVVVVPPKDGVPAQTLIVPRRNQGPIIAFDPSTGVALSVQYAGFAGTRELDCFLGFARARNLDDFTDALQDFDVGSQNFAYADVDGRIAWFTSGEAPLREDLQAGGVQGLPPFFIRDGTGGNEWLPVRHPEPAQALPYEILPFGEMPHGVDPIAGWFANANNDTLGVTLDNDPLNQLRPGGGLFYLNHSYAPGYRAGRLHTRCEAIVSGGGRMSFAQMEEIQADVAQRDAEVLVPYIVRAFENARAPGADSALAALAVDPAVAEAVGRLAVWDFSTPTGIPEGYDASDVDGVPGTPAPGEAESSVAATLFNVWRGEVLRDVIDATLAARGLPPPSRGLRALRVLLDNFDAHGGVGASGLDFFAVPGVSHAEDRRDLMLLQSLSDALDLLSGPSFASALHGSTRQSDYRWGMLHRAVFPHVLGDPFGIPPAGGAFPAPLPGLVGIPTDGGWTIDAAFFDVRADHADAFLFASGPSRRSVFDARPDGIRGVSIIPGGTSGELGDPHHFDQLPHWLTNDTFPVLSTRAAIAEDGGPTVHFVPGRRRGPPPPR